MDRGARVGVATAHRPEDLDAWKLAAELRERVLGWSQQLGPENAFLKSQIVRSVVSPPANLAEGFGHFKPRQFAKFARIARASLFETRDHLRLAVACTAMSEELANELIPLANRAIGAVTALIRYLDKCPADPLIGWNAPAARTHREG